MLAQPVDDRHREAHLGTGGPLIGQRLVGSVAEYLLVAVLVDAVAVGNVLGELHDLAIQEGHAQLQRVRHTHLVGLEQNVAREPHVHVQVLLLDQLGLALHARVDGCSELKGAVAGVVRGLEYAVDLALRPYQSLSQERLLGDLGTLDQEVMSLEVRHMQRQVAERAANGQRHHLFVLAHRNRVLVVGVAAKELVGTFARKHDGDILARHLGQEPQRHRRQVGLRLVHVILNVLECAKELVGGDHLANILDAELIG